MDAPDSSKSIAHPQGVCGAQNLRAWATSPTQDCWEQSSAWPQSEVSLHEYSLVLTTRQKLTRNLALLCPD